MSSPLRLWLAVSHHPAFRVGGWAFVRDDAGAVSGHAGGDRRLDAERAALQGLLAALADRPEGRPVQLHTDSDLVAAVPVRVRAAQAGEDPPEDNLDLWARAMTELAKGTVQVLSARPAPGGPLAFAAAWAELAQGKAKGQGPFRSPIPKSNLAKAGVPAPAP